MPDPPLVVIVAGPNGAGKSTTAPSLLRENLAVEEFVNADPIAQGLSGLRPESVAIAAGRVMLARLDELARAGRSFAFETTLASRSFAPWIGVRHAQGYQVYLLFLSLPAVSLALARVAARVRAGGHNVAEPVVRRRFRAGVRNFFAMYRNLVDAWQLYDNSAVRAPRLLAARAAGASEEILDLAAWRHLEDLAR